MGLNRQLVLRHVKSACHRRKQKTHEDKMKWNAEDKDKAQNHATMGTDVHKASCIARSASEMPNGGVSSTPPFFLKT